MPFQGFLQLNLPSGPMREGMRVARERKARKPVSERGRKLTKVGIREEVPAMEWAIGVDVAYLQQVVG